MKKLMKNQKGFTIIEVMIVLVIAAFILLMVFIAVPALQRSSRNTQRKSDVSRVGASVNDWISNNNGAVFTAGASNANLNTIVSDVGALGQYTLVPGTNFGVVTGTQAAMVTVANMVIVTGAQCGTGGATAASTNTRATAIQYALENGSGNLAAGTPVCLNI